MAIFDVFDERPSRLSPEARARWAQAHPEEAEQLRRAEVWRDLDPTVQQELTRNVVGAGRGGPDAVVADPGELSEAAFAAYQRLQPARAAAFVDERERADLWEGLDPDVRNELTNSTAGARRGGPDSLVEDPGELSEAALAAYRQLQPEHVARWTADEARRDLYEGLDPAIRDELDSGSGAARRGPDTRVQDPRELSDEAFEVYRQLQPEHAAEFADDRARAAVWEGLDRDVRNELTNSTAGARRGGPDSLVEDPGELSEAALEAYRQLQPQHVARWTADEARRDLYEGLDPAIRDELDSGSGAARRGPDTRVHDPRELSDEAFEVYRQLQPEHAAEFADDRARAAVWEGLDRDVQNELTNNTAGARRGGPDSLVADPGALSDEAYRAYEQLHPEHAARWAAQQEIADINAGTVAAPPPPAPAPPAVPDAASEPALLQVVLPPEDQNEMADPDGDGIGGHELRTEAYVPYDPAADDPLGLEAATAPAAFVPDPAGDAGEAFAAEAPATAPAPIERLAAVEADMAFLAAPFEAEPEPAPVEVVEVVEVVGSGDLFEIDHDAPPDIVLPPPPEGDGDGMP